MAAGAVFVGLVEHGRETGVCVPGPGGVDRAFDPAPGSDGRRGELRAQTPAPMPASAAAADQPALRGLRPRRAGRPLGRGLESRPTPAAFPRPPPIAVQPVRPRAAEAQDAQDPPREASANPLHHRAGRDVTPPVMGAEGRETGPAWWRRPARALRSGRAGRPAPPPGRDLRHLPPRSAAQSRAPGPSASPKQRGAPSAWRPATGVQDREGDPAPPRRSTGWGRPARPPAPRRRGAIVRGAAHCRSPAPRRHPPRRRMFSAPGKVSRAPATHRSPCWAGRSPPRPRRWTAARSARRPDGQAAGLRPVDPPALRSGSFVPLSFHPGSAAAQGPGARTPPKDRSAATPAKGRQEYESPFGVRNHPPPGVEGPGDLLLQPGDLDAHPGGVRCIAGARGEIRRGAARDRLGQGGRPAWSFHSCTRSVRTLRPRRLRAPASVHLPADRPPPTSRPRAFAPAVSSTPRGRGPPRRSPPFGGGPAPPSRAGPRGLRMVRAGKRSDRWLPCVDQRARGAAGPTSTRQEHRAAGGAHARAGSGTGSAACSSRAIAAASEVEPEDGRRSPPTFSVEEIGSPSPTGSGRFRLGLGAGLARKVSARA